MQELNTHAINWCNRLIQTCEDGASGYRTAAGAVEQTSLAEMFEDFAEQRDFMVTDLQGEVVSLGSEPTIGGSLAGLLHRGWMNIKSVATQHDELAVLEECETGDQAALDQYGEPLADELPSSTRQLFLTHQEKLRDSLSQIRSLRSAAL